MQRKGKRTKRLLGRRKESEEEVMHALVEEKR